MKLVSGKRDTNSYEILKESFRLTLEWKVCVVEREAIAADRY